MVPGAIRKRSLDTSGCQHFRSDLVQNVNHFYQVTHQSASWKQPQTLAFQNANLDCWNMTVKTTSFMILAVD